MDLLRVIFFRKTSFPMTFYGIVVLVITIISLIIDLLSFLLK